MKLSGIIARLRVFIVQKFAAWKTKLASIVKRGYNHKADDMFTATGVNRSSYEGLKASIAVALKLLPSKSTVVEALDKLPVSRKALTLLLVNTTVKYFTQEVGKPYDHKNDSFYGAIGVDIERIQEMENDVMQALANEKVPSERVQFLEESDYTRRELASVIVTLDKIVREKNMPVPVDQEGLLRQILGIRRSHPESN